MLRSATRAVVVNQVGSVSPPMPRTSAISPAASRKRGAVGSQLSRLDVEFGIAHRPARRRGRAGYMLALLLPIGARKRTIHTALIERIEMSAHQIDIRLQPPRLGALLDVTAAFCRA